MGSVTYLLEVYVMESHVYQFEFKYDRQVYGKKTEFTVPVIVHNECFADACTKVEEFVRKNFADRVTEESTIKYVGEFVHGVLKPFVEVKEETDVNSMYPQAVDVCKVYKIERDQALKENEALKKRVKYLIERNNRFEVNEKYYDEEYRKLSDEKQTHEMVINGYNKELSQLNLLMDDMENRLEKQVVAREGMLKQLREYKEEKKRMNKIIDALTEDK